MSCIDDIISGERVIIGIRNYTGCQDPEGKLYINDLPGFSLKNAANIAPESFSTGYDFLKHCNTMAVRHVFDEFAVELGPYFDFGNIIETRDVKTFKTTPNAVSATERGIVIKRWRSEAARMFVEYVYINVEQAGTVDLNIIDGDLTTTQEIELVAGINEIRLDYKANEEQIKITFDQSAFETYDGAWTKGGCSSCGGGGKKGLYITGWDGTKEVSNTYGFGVKVHAQCYEENVMCSLLPKMYFLLWYKSGILVLREHVATNRINHIATFGQERAKDLLVELEAEYKEKYQVLVKGAYNYLRTMKGDCITCNGIRYVQATP